MTYVRTPGTAKAVLLRAIGALSPEEITDATGKSANHFYQLTSPRNDRLPNIQECAQLAGALAVRGHADWFADLHEQTRNQTAERLGGAAPVAHYSDACLRRIVVLLGDAFAHEERAMEDGVYTLQERAQRAHILDEIIDWARKCKDAVEPPGDVAVLRGAR